MLKSNNFNSIIDELSAFGLDTDNNFEALRPNTLDLETTTNNEVLPQQCIKTIMPTTTTDTQLQSLPQYNNLHSMNNNAPPCTSSVTSGHVNDSLAVVQLTAGFLQKCTPPLAKARSQLKELIGKQNKIYIDLSTERCKLDNSEVAKLEDMMNDVKVYREKLYKIKKQMQNVYQRTKVLKKRSLHIQTCKEKEYQRKVHKQKQEESLIGKQQ